MRVVFIDNHDSFTWNLVDEFARRDAEVEVWRNDTDLAHLLGRVNGDGPVLLVLSPGPGAPAQAGVCIDLIRAVGDRVPILGVCLGHQAIVEAYGGLVGPAGEIVHGKSARVRHSGGPVLDALPSPVTVGRYHSLAADRVPDDLLVTATLDRDDDGPPLVMAVRHRSHPVLGLQFHPESILTPEGGLLIAAALSWAGTVHSSPSAAEARP